ncbi:hypothetical protein [Flavobacterium sp. U410]
MQEIHYQEKKINDFIKSLNSNLDAINQLNEYFSYCQQGEEESICKKIDNHTWNFNKDLRLLCLVILAYLEKKDYKNYYSLFLTFSKDIINKKRKHFINVFNNDEEQESWFYSKSLNELITFLEPFYSFDKDFNNKPGILYLENILKSTSIILKDLQIVPTCEKEVYDGVKFVIKNTYIDHVKTYKISGSAKTYIPDILLPSLNCAIEYKYANDLNKLIETIDQIVIDVKGYSNDPIYKHFYAVFYVKTGICAEHRFNEIWNSKDFPDNWSPIFIIGE